MSGIGGVRKESNNETFAKHVGLFEAKVVAINPTIEEYKSKLGIELKEDSKVIEYTGTSKDGNDTLRIDFWLQDIKTENNFKLTFYLENKERQNNAKTKYQFINDVGMCSWGESENDLADWFKGEEDSPRNIRIAHSGEEELYDFLRIWLNKLDLRKSATTLELEWKKLMKGNVSELRSQINGEWCDTVCALATITSKERDGEVKEYQTIYNKAFLQGSALKLFKVVDYTNNTTINNLKKKSNKELKMHERFIIKVTGEYGCKDYYILKDIEEYNPSNNLVSSNDAILEDDSEY